MKKQKQFLLFKAIVLIMVFFTGFLSKNHANTNSIQIISHQTQNRLGASHQTLPTRNIITYEDFEPLTISLHEIFKPATGQFGDICYSVETGNLTAVHAYIKAKSLIIKPVKNAYGSENIVVKAFDKSNSSNYIETVLHLKIKAVNDAPYIVNPLGERYFDEDFQDYVIDLSAVFHDVDLKTGRLSYEIVDYDDSFVNVELRKSRMTIKSVANAFGYGNAIVVKATDNGNPPKSVEDILTVHVESVNDAPQVKNSKGMIHQFKNYYAFEIPLDSIFSDVDEDYGILSYDIVSDNNTAIPVSIHQNKLRVETLRNYEGEKNLTIRASDNGTPSLSVDYDLKINISGINHAPFVKAALGEMAITQGFCDFTVDLYDIFGDVENQPGEMRYEIDAHSQLVDVSAAIADGHILKIESLPQKKSNRNNIIVTAFDTHGKWIKDTLLLHTIPKRQPAENPLQISTKVTNINCFGDQSGAIEINATGGFGNYRYSIDNGKRFSGKNIFDKLHSGRYEIVVKDSSENSLSHSVFITQPEDLNIGLIPPSNKNNNNISTLHIEGGNPPYFLYYSNGIVSRSHTKLSRQTYSIDEALTTSSAFFHALVIDNNGCAATENFYITPYRKRKIQHAHTDKHENSSNNETIEKKRLVNTSEISLRKWNKDDIAISVYPNPGSGQFVFDCQSRKTIEQAEVFVISLEGKIILNEKININGKTFHKSYDISAHPAGIYVLQLVVEGYVYSERIVLTKK